jgi:hypothetical protein
VTGLSIRGSCNLILQIIRAFDVRVYRQRYDIGTECQCAFNRRQRGVPRMSSTSWRIEKCLASAKNRTTNRPVRSLTRNTNPGTPALHAVQK